MAQTPPEPHTPLTRQGFLKLGLGFLASHLSDRVNEIPMVQAATALRLRPPGALAEAAFLNTCQPFCSACASACPKGAIFADPFGFPTIDPLKAPCVLCTDVPCTQVCPTGALTPLTDPRQIALGLAQIEVTQCLAYQGKACDVCITTCPISGEAITQTEGLPQILAEGCTGCGVCVFHCPQPGALQIRPQTP